MTTFHLGRWSRRRSDLAAILAGTVAGAVFLGVGGRLAMAALAITNRKRPEFSWAGSLDVVVLGTLYGAIGGVLLALLRRVWPRGKRWRGIGLAAILLGVAWASSTVGRQTAEVAPVSVLTVLAISFVVFVVYGVVADTLAERWQPERP